MRLSTLFAALAAVPLLATPAFAQSWQVEDGAATAILPAPSAGARFSGGTLSCAEQRWTLRLSAAPNAALDAVAGPATLAIDRQAIEAEATATLEGVAVDIPYQAIEPLKAGWRLTATFGGGGESETVFLLRGSRRAITAAEEHCTPRVLPAENRVVFSPYSSYLNLARELRAQEMEAFRAATSSQPQVSAAMTDLGGTGRLLFVELCGSSWYYGLSGCNIAVFAAEGDSDEWRLVLDSEGAALYADPDQTVDGWPSLTALPAKGPGEEHRWRWNGTEYRLEDLAEETVESGSDGSDEG